jgi:acyl carrier protein
MEKSYILETLKGFIKECNGIDPVEITMYASLSDDLDLGEIEIIEITMSAEEEFGIEIPQDVINGFNTVGGIVDYIHGKL